MTATRSAPALVTADSRVRTHRKDIAIASAIVALALVLRLIRHSTNYELFVDEVSYSNIGLAIASGKGALLYGQPFFLHPPIFMYVLATTIDLLGKPHTVVGLVMQLRVVNACIGTIDVALMMCVTYRVVGRRWSVAAGLFMALDPYLLLYDGRVMLETLAMTASTAGMLSFLALAARVRAADRADPSSRPSRGLPCAVLTGAAGLGFGVALLTKETYAFVGVVPVALILFTGWYVPRRWSGAVLLTAVGCYVLYLVTVLASGRLDAWWSQQHSGLLRATGERQTSGFNQPGRHVGFATRLFATASHYFGTYLVMALATLAVAWGIRRWWRSDRRGRDLASQDVMTLWAGCAGCYAAFSALRGAFEPQIFYPFLVAAVPVTLLAAQSWTTGGRPGGLARVISVFIAVLLGGVLVYNALVDVRVRTSVDAAYIDTVQWVAKHVPHGDLVDTTDGVSQFVLTGLRIETINSLSGVLLTRPSYLIYSSTLVNQGYVTLTGGLGQFLKRHATARYRALDKSRSAPWSSISFPGRVPP